jgi:hypothetical protein
MSSANCREQVATTVIRLNATAPLAAEDVHQLWTSRAAWHPGSLPRPERTAPASGEPKGRFGPQSVNVLQFATQILQFG